MIKKSTIADSIHGNIQLSTFERRVLSHVMFNRLHDVYQNSTVYMTFPCNRTKRFEHSIGTMELCSKIFYSSIKNAQVSDAEDFLELYQKKLFEFMQDLRKDKAPYADILGYRTRKIKEKMIPPPELYNVFFDCPLNAVKYNSTYLIIIQAIRLAALLHDIGHPPFSHIAEFALSSIYDKTTAETNEGKEISTFIEIMKAFTLNPKQKLHEQMGNRIAEIIVKDSIDSISAELADSNTDLYNEKLFEILIARTTIEIFTNKEFEDIHNIIDGSLDGDRLDYSTRDALNSGLKKGEIEYDRLINSMALIKHNDNYLFCPSIKVVNTVEDFLERRWSVYKDIIFHHHVVKTDYLMQHVIESISLAYLNGELKTKKDNFKNTEKQVDEDDSTDLLPNDISGLWKALKPWTSADSSYAISQWDDSWLLTVLKKHFFTDYINDNSKSPITTKQLSELLMNKRYYISTVKRLEDFLIVDNAISFELNSFTKNVEASIKKLRRLSKSNTSPDQTKVTIEPFLKVVEESLAAAETISKNRQNDLDVFQSLIFIYIKKIYAFKFIEDGKKKGSDELADMIKNAATNCKIFLPENGNSIEDIICIVKSYDIGLKKPIMFYSNKSGKGVVSIHEISSISKILDLSYQTFPQFFVYILPKTNYIDTKLDIDSYLQEVGKEIARKTKELIMTTIDSQIQVYESIIKAKENTNNV